MARRFPAAQSSSFPVLPGRRAELEAPRCRTGFWRRTVAQKWPHEGEAIALRHVVADAEDRQPRPGSAALQVLGGLEEMS